MNRHGFWVFKKGRCKRSSREENSERTRSVRAVRTVRKLPKTRRQRKRRSRPSWRDKKPKTCSISMTTTTTSSRTKSRVNSEEEEEERLRRCLPICSHHLRTRMFRRTRSTTCWDCLGLLHHLLLWTRRINTISSLLRLRLRQQQPHQPQEEEEEVRAVWMRSHLSTSTLPLDRSKRNRTEETTGLTTSCSEPIDPPRAARRVVFLFSLSTVAHFSDLLSLPPSQSMQIPPPPL